MTSTDCYYKIADCFFVFNVYSFDIFKFDPSNKEMHSNVIGVDSSILFIASLSLKLDVARQ